MSERGSLLDRLTGGDASPDEDPRAAHFVRGLAIGAIVGAAIAGSALLQRRRSAERPATPEPPPAKPTSVAAPADPTTTPADDA